MPQKPLDSLQFVERNRLEWAAVQRRLFPISAPSRATWEDLDEIVEVVNLIGRIQDLCHVLLPGRGGVDLVGAETSHEPGCIALLTPGTTHVAKAERLHFESFRNDPQWSYFWLEA